MSPPVVNCKKRKTFGQTILPNPTTEKCNQVGCPVRWLSGDTCAEEQHRAKCEYGLRWYDYKVCLCVHPVHSPDPRHTKTCALQILARGDADECKDMGEQIRRAIKRRFQLDDVYDSIHVQEAFPVHTPPLSPFIGTVLDPTIFRPTCATVRVPTAIPRIGV